MLKSEYFLFSNRFLQAASTKRIAQFLLNKSVRITRPKSNKSKQIERDSDNNETKKSSNTLLFDGLLQLNQIKIELWY